MKPKPLNFIVDCGTYPFDVMVSVGQTDEELFKTLGKYLPEDNIEDGDAKYKQEAQFGYMIAFGTGTFMIRLRGIPKTPYQRGVFAHEVFHVVEYLFDRIRIIHSIDSGESFAYQIQYLTEKIYEKLNQ